MRLEALAQGADRRDRGYDLTGDGSVIVTDQVFAQIHDDQVAGLALDEIAWGFHDALARAFAAQALRLLEAGEAQAVVLSGGCLQNALLQARLLHHLGDVPVLTHRVTPANDGGLALGQALIAAATLL